MILFVESVSHWTLITVPGNRLIDDLPPRHRHPPSGLRWYHRQHENFFVILRKE